MIECRGLVAMIEAADAAVKAANVKLVDREKTMRGWSPRLRGEVAAVKAAVGAAGRKVGKVLSTHVIPRPHSKYRRCDSCAAYGKLQGRKSAARCLRANKTPASVPR